MGQADTGQTWVALANTWGITAQTAYTPAALSDSVTVVDSGVSDGLVSTTVADSTGTLTALGVYARVVDTSNWVRLVFSSGSMFLQKRVAGTTTTVASVTQTVAVGDVFAIRLAGSSVTGYRNGVDLFAGAKTITNFLTTTRHGIGCATGTTSGRWRSFSVSA